MGRTSFAGPVYGAKSLLWAFRADNLPASTAAQTVASIIVPKGSDWYPTEMHVYRGSSFSTALVVTLTDDSTTVGDVAVTSSLAGATASTVFAKTAGEYEGQQIVSGSSVSLLVSNGNSSAAGSSAVNVWVYGYVRFNSTSSTRAF